jgi:hypothetical protein
VDDVVVKTRNSDTLIADLEETFASLPVEGQPEQVRLRRTFGITTWLHHQPSWHRSQPREDLRHHQDESSLLHQRRAEAHRVYGRPEQIHLKAWRMGTTLLQTTQDQARFVWTHEAEQALAQLKDFLSKNPFLTAPRKKEQLLLYLAATTHVVSTAIVVKWQKVGHAYPVHQLVYFVSKVLSESKARYQPV